MNDQSKCPEGTEPNPNRAKGQRKCRVTCKNDEYRDETTFKCLKKNTRKKRSLAKSVNSSLSVKKTPEPETKGESAVSSSISLNSLSNSSSSDKKTAKSTDPETEDESIHSAVSSAKSINRNHESATKAHTQTLHPCDEYSRLLNERKGLNAIISKANAKCEDEKFNEIQKYFDYGDGIKHTHKDLLTALQKLYIDMKDKDPNCMLTLTNFITMFPRDTMTTNKFKRQHVFEAICRLLLMYDYDNGELGRKKEFYKSLNDIVNNNDLRPNLTGELILKTKINESSAGGVADIVFQTDYIPPDKTCKDDWMCDCSIDIEQIQQPKANKKLICISNKYFDVEKTGNKDEYDVHKIFGVANELKQVEGFDTQIVLMVNNKQSLDSKLSSRGVKPDGIYGTFEIEEWFRKLIVDLRKNKTIDQFLENHGKNNDKTKGKPDLKPRFHQMYFTNTTLKYNNMGMGHKMFIWGAVPRSGKSYMIGDLISNRGRRALEEQENDIVLILGAKTETESQFKYMFDGFTNFNDYGIIIASDTSNTVNNKVKDKNIYIFSQEWFKSGKIIDNSGDFKRMNKKRMKLEDRLKRENKEDKKNELANQLMELIYKISKYKQLNQSDQTFDKDSVINRFKQLFEKKKIDLYFDEIHKGGSTDKSKSILNAFDNAGVKIDLFIMVTATFAKPNIKYETGFIDIHNKRTKVIEWSYEDQQNMKQVQDETKREMMINSRKYKDKDTIESQALSGIFDKYKDEYGISNYLDIISNEYANNPELVLIQPESLTKFQSSSKRNTIDIPSVFIQNLKCDACKTSQTKEQLRDPSNIFEDPASVRDLINYIGKIDDNVVDTKCIYSHLRKMGAPTNGAIPHSELWFLPDKNLYLNPSFCKGICKEILVEDNQDEETDNKSGLPNIEPLTRGLALLLMENTYFKKRYNVLIVQNTPMNYTHSGGTAKWKPIELEFSEKSNIHTIVGDKRSLSEIIKSYEKFTFDSAKSLIILTGAKMRLGISLPCVDVAFNFDTISAVDNNYQTMFRVLTERTNRPKKFGFYVDMNKNRATQFLYEYNNTYGSGKNEHDSKKRLAFLQSLMLMFNYNGIGLVKQDANKELQLYNSLIEHLELTDTKYTVYNSKLSTIQNLIKKSIGNLSNETLKEFKNIIGKRTTNQQKGKIKQILKQGESNIQNRGEGEEEYNGDGEDEKYEEDESEEEDEDEDETSDLINILVEYLPSIIALLALFSHENGYNCESIEMCIEKCKTNLDSLDDILCNCDADKSSILACYMNQSDDTRYSKTSLYKFLNVITKMIAEPESIQLSVNLNIIFDNIRESMGKNNDALIISMSAEDVQDKIIEYLPVRDEEKDKFGEVFTPAALINEMLDKLPPGVWSDPTKKWLDPANGIGNFPMIVYKRLMEKLPDKYDKDGVKYSDKSKHILKNMLYMCEINKKNVAISRRIFGSEQDANICCCDFLNEEEKWKKQFGIEQFDIIIGNPPFQKEQEGKREGGFGGRTLWDQFIVKSLELLKPNGYLTFINPPPWRKPEHELYKLMTQDNQLLYLHIFNKKQGQQLFDVSQRVDLYVIEKKTKYKNTIIIDELGKTNDFDLSKWSFLPNYEYNSIKKIMNSEENKDNVIYDRTIYGTDKKNMNSTKTSEYKFPVVHSITQEGMVFWYTNDKSKGHFGVPKVLLNFNENQYPVNDFEGKYGMSQITFGIPITSKKQGDDIVNAINTDEFKEIIKATKWGVFQTDWRMFKYFKPDFYKQFLGKASAATKIQAVARGKQTRKKKLKTTGGKTRRKRWSLF
jgi:hypothetical protein